MFHSGKVGLCLAAFPSVHGRKSYLHFFGKVALCQEAPLPDSLAFFRKALLAAPLRPYANNIFPCFALAPQGAGKTEKNIIFAYADIISYG